MIYLIESAGFNETRTGFIRLLKIGYTEDSNKDRRFAQYKMHNPTCEVLYTIPGGNEDEESLLHSKFVDYKFKGYGREWFIWNQDIIDYFDSHRTKESLKDLGSIISSNNTSSPRLRRYIKNYISRVMNYLMSLDSNKLSGPEILENVKIDKEAIIDDVKYFKFVWDYFEDKYGVTRDDIKTYYSKISKKTPKVFNYFSEFKNLPGYKEKMRLFCETEFTEEEKFYILTQIPIKYRIYYDTLGPDRLKALGYDITRCHKLFSDFTDVDIIEKVARSVYDTFKVGSRYPKSDIKTTLAGIYQTYGLNRVAKANDLENYFDTKECLISGGGKRNRGYEILGIKKL